MAREVQAVASVQVWGGASDIASAFAGGDGTKENPFQISNGSELARLGMIVNTNYDNARYNNSDVHYCLTSDIWLNKDNSPMNNWEPIGGGIGFAANFNGRNHSIYGLYVNRSEDWVGLFRHTNGARIENFAVRSANVRTQGSGGPKAGGIVAMSENSVLSNLIFDGKVLLSTWAGAGEAGGIVGHKVGGAIINSISLGIIEHSGSVMAVGGIIGGVGWIDTPIVLNSFFIQTDTINYGLSFDQWNNAEVINCYTFDEYMILSDGRSLVEVANSWVKENKEYFETEHGISLTVWGVEYGNIVLGEPNVQEYPDCEEEPTLPEEECCGESSNRNPSPWIWILLPLLLTSVIGFVCYFILAKRRNSY
ncbi:MAG: hypothetical protein FWC00_04560 [Firmicutes bacterium]|nr:hypothetical protein [Bacillota bacterium]